MKGGLDMFLHFRNLRPSSLLACVLAVLLLSACGGGSSSNTAPRASGSESPPAGEINGITVPAEPSSALVNATLAGVDTNGNKVRDEVDRSIARSYGTTPANYNAAMVYAAKVQAALVQVAPTQAEAKSAISKELEAFECLKSQVGVESARIISQEVEIRTFHPRLRSDERQRLLQSAGLHVLPTVGVGSC